MKRIGIVTDSHSSIAPQQAAILGVHVLPMPFTIDGQSYLEGVNLSREEFFAYQRAGAEIATSQPAPGSVMALWDELLEKYEQLLYLPISSGLSGSWQTACALAADEPYVGRVVVVDAGRVATPLHQTVLDAISLVDAGYSATECRRILEEGRSDMCIYIAVQTLDNLRRGGRISPAVATVGTLLNIKPILQLSTGKLDAYKKTRGMIKARETMLEAIRSDLAIRFREAQSEGRVQLLAAGSASPEETARWIAQIEASFPGMPVLYDDLSLGVSCHTGEGALGVGLSVRPRL